MSFYTVLNVERNASQAAIRRAYLELARKYHPDRNPHSTAARSDFKKVLRAYEVLSDPHLRLLYDRDPGRFQIDDERAAQGCAPVGGRSSSTGHAPVHTSSSTSPANATDVWHAGQLLRPIPAVSPRRTAYRASVLFSVLLCLVACLVWVVRGNPARSVVLRTSAQRGTAVQNALVVASSVSRRAQEPAPSNPKSDGPAPADVLPQATDPIGKSSDERKSPTPTADHRLVVDDELAWRQMGIRNIATIDSAAEFSWQTDLEHIDRMIDDQAAHGWPSSLHPLETIPGTDVDVTVPPGSPVNLHSDRSFHYPRADELVELRLSDPAQPLSNRPGTIERLSSVPRTEGPFAGQSRYDAPSDALGHWPATTLLDAGDTLDRTSAASASQSSAAAAGIDSASHRKSWDQHESWRQWNQADFYATPLGMLKYRSELADHAPTAPYGAYDIPAARMWPPAGTPAAGWWPNGAVTENVWGPTMSSSAAERSRGLPTRSTPLARPSPPSEGPWIWPWIPVPIRHAPSSPSTLDASSPTDGYSDWRSMDFPATSTDY